MAYHWTVTPSDGTAAFPLTGISPSFIARSRTSYTVVLSVDNASTGAPVTVTAPPIVANAIPLGGNIVTATLSGGLLTLTGNANANDLLIEAGAAGMNSARITGRNGTQVKFGASAPPPSGTQFNFAGLSRGIAVSLLGGNDRIAVNGTNMRDIIRLDGGVGDDLYLISTKSTQLSIIDSAGNDQISLADMSAGINLDLSQASGARLTIGNGNTLALTGTIENAIGTQFVDTLIGNASANVLIGLGGNDRLYGRSGNDVLDGGVGNDFLYGEQGTDTLYGGNGDDNLSGGSEGDILLGGAGNDTLGGDDGNDFLIGGLGVDTLHGGLGDDILVGGATKFDNYDVALASLLQTWTSVNPTSVRINKLRGSQTNGAFDFSIARTLDDGAADSLFGDSGNDWFLARLAEPDQLRDVETSRDEVER